LRILESGGIAYALSAAISCSSQGQSSRSKVTSEVHHNLYAEQVASVLISSFFPVMTRTDSQTDEQQHTCFKRPKNNNKR